ncbi:hypothetical protein THRCLA_05120 [Thraustotheca clavata]|uniref:Uncharacterized protein n=1 Tax=Thraustotheca clavata TaxID=74557 RepID=A0A1V9ZWX0_9STRA|nr:hypothetical protein THRCLA_05120 [Thraustotheca clavata]
MDNAMMIQKCSFIGAVTALAFSSDGSLLYAAVGSTVYLYATATGALVHSFAAFNHGIIHGVDLFGSHAVFFGQKQLAIVEHIPQHPQDDCKMIHIVRKEFRDWILDARILHEKIDGIESILIATGMAHNVVDIWNPKHDQIVKSVRCSERSILYAMGIYGRSLDTIIVAAGTVFQHILLWNPMGDGNAVQTLHQHDGVLFKLQWSKNGRFLTSVSDDRSVQLWSNVNNATFTDLQLPSLSQNQALSHNFYSVFRGWGHTARVWDVKFCGLGIITASEDATCRLWGFNGSCLAVLLGHTDVNVWRVAVHPKQSHIIASGGGDNAIKLWDLNLEQFNQHPSGLVLSIPFINSKPANVRAMVTLMSSVFSITDQSTLIAQEISNPSNNVVIPLGFNPCCLDVSDQFVAIGNVIGEVYLYNHSIFSQQPQLQQDVFMNWQAHDKSRVMHLWFYGSNRILTSGVDLTLKEWIIDASTKTITLLRSFVCPSKTCISSFAFSESVLACGDGRGNIAFYDLSTTIQIQPTQVLHQCHQKNVVSSMTWHDNRLYSSGHDGYINVVEIPPNCTQFISTRRQSVKGISTLKKIWFTKNNDLLAFGFHATLALVVNTTKQYRTLALECGGWRRPNSLYMSTDDDIHHTFCAASKTSNDGIFVHSSSQLKHPVTATHSWHGQNHHSKMGICVVWEPISKLFVSGGEDNALKVYKFNPNTNSTQCIDSVSMHITNVRALVVGTPDNQVPVLISAGGKQSVHVWHLWEERLQHVTEYTPTEVTQDQRILSLASTGLISQQHLILAPNSEGVINVLVANTAKRSIVQVGSFTNCQKPILSCGLFHHGAFIYFATGATDGNIVLWNLSLIYQQLFSCGTANFDDLKPVYTYRAHDMGVNCLNVLAIDEFTFKIVSGGDNQCITLSTIMIQSSGSINVIHHSGIHNASASALKAITSTTNVVLAAGYDQRLIAWQWNATKTSLSFQSSSFLETADIASLSVLEEESTSLHVVAVGKGLQVLTLQ